MEMQTHYYRYSYDSPENLLNHREKYYQKSPPHQNTKFSPQLSSHNSINQKSQDFH